MMKYVFAEDIQKKAEEIAEFLFPHIKLGNFKCFRSVGTSSRTTIARCHGMAKIMQKALDIKPFYALEFLSEKFDKLEEEEKTKTIMHELMHIPKNFGGGFKHHDFVTDRNVNKYYKEYIRKKDDKEKQQGLF
jgi:predicted metallopeptidase